jgi:hypothetical protein
MRSRDQRLADGKVERDTVARQHQGTEKSRCSRRDACRNSRPSRRTTLSATPRNWKKNLYQELRS